MNEIDLTRASMDYRPQREGEPWRFLLVGLDCKESDFLTFNVRNPPLWVALRGSFVFMKMDVMTLGEALGLSAEGWRMYRREPSAMFTPGRPLFYYERTFKNE